VTDVCGSNGVCAGSAKNCNDNQPCTLDSCNTTTGNCVNNASALLGAACSDGNACTIGDSCNGIAAGCTAGTTAANCDDGNACTTDTCNSATGCSNTNNTANCDDGNFCTSGEKCASGVCGGGVARDADGDGFVAAACTSSNKDCDDANNQIRPTATEICDNVDNNCSATTDEGCDDDNDDYCDSSITHSPAAGTFVQTCSKGTGDCNDANVLINPGAVDVLEPTRSGPWTATAATGGTSNGTIRVRISPNNRAFVGIGFDDRTNVAKPRRIMLATRPSGSASSNRWVGILPPVTPNDVSVQDVVVTNDSLGTASTGDVVHVFTVRLNPSTNTYQIVDLSSPISTLYKLRNWTTTVVASTGITANTRVRADVNVSSSNSPLYLMWSGSSAGYAVRDTTKGEWSVGGATTPVLPANFELSVDDTGACHVVYVITAQLSFSPFTEYNNVRHATDRGSVGSTFAATTLAGGFGSPAAPDGYTQPNVLVSHAGTTDTVHTFWLAKDTGTGLFQSRYRKKLVTDASFGSETSGVCSDGANVPTAVARNATGIDVFSADGGYTFKPDSGLGSCWASSPSNVSTFGAILPISFTGASSGPGTIVAFDGASNVVEYAPSGTSSTWVRNMVMPAFAKDFAMPRQTAAIDGLVGLLAGSTNSPNSSLVGGSVAAPYALTRAIWWGDAIALHPYNPELANASTTGETPLAVANSGSSTYALALDKQSGQIYGHYWATPDASPGTLAQIPLSTYTYVAGLPKPELAPLNNDFFIGLAMGDPGNGLDLRFLRLGKDGTVTSSAWPLAETGFTSSIALMYRTFTTTTTQNWSAFGFDCGGQGLRSAVYTLSQNVGTGAYSASVGSTSVWSTDSCSRVWAARDTSTGHIGSGSYHVFAVINQSLVHFYSTSGSTNGSSWEQRIVVDNISESDAIEVSASLRGSPVVLVNSTAYRFDRGATDPATSAWAATALLDASWYTTTPSAAWGLAARDDGDSAWGIYGLNMFSSGYSSFFRDSWVSLIPSNTVDQNCNGNPSP
jgi:hypothetical protein